MLPDINLLRDLLIDIEGTRTVDLSPYGREEIVATLVLLIEEGLVEGDVVRVVDRPWQVRAVTAYGLAHLGRVYLKAIESPELWAMLTEARSWVEEDPDASPQELLEELRQAHRFSAN